MVIVEMNGQLVRIGSLLDQIYSLEDEKGWQHHWNVTEGMRIAAARGGLTYFSPTEYDVTVEEIHRVYQDLNIAHALTTNLTRPILFVMLNGHMQLADGWHRLYKAVVTKANRLPAYILSEEESEKILMFRLPPGGGLDWGQQSHNRTGDPADAAHEKGGRP
jgi:hypothetical protein